MGLLTLATASASAQEGSGVGEATPNRVLVLDGHGDFVRLPAHTFGDLREATVEAWVRWDRLGYFSQWFAFGTDEEFHGVGLNHAETTTTLQFFLYDRQRKLYLLQAPTDLPRGRWYHMAAVAGRDGMRLYLDGVPVASHPFSGGFAATGGGADNYLGRSHWSVNPEFLGALDEVRVWSAARTGQQIRQMMHSRLSGGEPGLVALWNFDSGCEEDARVVDASPNGLHGERHGDARCVEGAPPASVQAPARWTGRVVDTTGRPVAQAAVRLLQDGGRVAEARADTGGLFHFTLFGGGRYDLQAQRDELGAWLPDLQVDAGQERSLTVRLDQPRIISGTVRSHDGIPVAAVIVQLLAPESEVWAEPRAVRTLRTDDRGGFLFQHPPPGPHIIRSHLADGFVERRVAAGRDASLDLEVTPLRKGTWRTYDALDGLTSNNITDILETRDGLLWLATEGTGVWSFDGEVFTRFTTDDGLPHNQANALAETDHGLYVGTEEGLARFDGRSFTTFTTEHGLPHGSVTALFDGGDGALWIGTTAGVARLEGGMFTPLPTLAALRGHEVIAILQDRDGLWYFGTELEGLWRYDGDRLIDIGYYEGLAHTVAGVLETEDGVWIGALGITLFDGTSFHHQPLPDDLPEQWVHDTAAASDGAVYLATAGGVLHWDGRHLTDVTAATGLVDQSIHSVHVDRGGRLWFGSEGGSLTRYDPDSFASYTSADGLAADRVTALAGRDDGGLWIGTERGVRRFDGQFTVEGDDRELAYPVGGLAARADTLWIGFDNPDLSHPVDGGWRLVGGRFERFTPETGEVHYQGVVRDIHRSGTGDLFFATRGGALHFDGQHFVPLTVDHGLPLNELAAVYQTDAGVLYLGSSGAGLSSFDGKTITTLTTADGLPDDGVRVLHGGPDGHLWIGTNAGLSTLQGDAVVSTYTAADGLAHSRIEDLVHDTRGRLWVATSGGVSVFDGSAWSTLDRRDGLPANSTLALVTGVDGRVWIGTGAGLAGYRPDVAPPRVRILSARTDRAFAAPASIDPLQADTRISVDYRAIDFKTLPEKRQYRVRVAGRDSAWLPPSPDSRFEWIPHEPGEYVLEVQAIDRDLNYSEPARLPFTVVLPWYRNAWITGPAGTSLAGVLLVVVMLLVKSIGQRRETRRLLEEREAEARRALILSRLREEIWRMRDPDDFQRVLTALRESLAQLEIGFHQCGVNIVDDAVALSGRSYTMRRDGGWETGDMGAEMVQFILGVQDSEMPSYRPNLAADDAFEEREDLEAGYGTPILSVIDVPFSAGTLAVNSVEADAFSQDHVEMLQALGRVMGEGLQRLGDLHTLEHRNEALEREIAQRQQAERELQRSKDEAEAANVAKSAFLANMSHELRTPLNAILGFCQLLRRNSTLSGEDGANLETIHSSGEHLLDLINSVLDMSRIEAGQTTVEDSDFDLPTFLQSLTEMFRLRAIESGLTLACEMDDGLPRFVRADEGKLRQILINLLGNAIKFTSEGSVTMRATVATGRLQVEVEDTGPGLSETEQAGLFEAFAQTQVGREFRGGTGLGLAISRQFAQIMDGSLVVRSEPGVGSVFTLQIPFVELDSLSESTAESRGRVVGLQAGQGPFRVLIAEDVEANRRLMRSILDPLGLEIREAEDGQQAVEIAQAWRPHMVWMDMRMPVIDGYEATRRIKSMPDAPVVVALTASAFEEDRQQVLEAGCDDFVRKPAREEDIFAAMERHLGLRYIYERPGAAEAESVVIDDAVLAGLPSEWREAMRTAATEADEDRIAELIQQVVESHPTVAEGLASMTRDYRYDEMIGLLGEAP